jgi:hypothetical protein
MERTSEILMINYSHKLRRQFERELEVSLSSYITSRSRVKKIKTGQQQQQKDPAWKSNRFTLSLLS